MGKVPWNEAHNVVPTYMYLINRGLYSQKIPPGEKRKNKLCSKNRNYIFEPARHETVARAVYFKWRNLFFYIL